MLIRSLTYKIDDHKFVDTDSVAAIEPGKKGGSSIILKNVGITGMGDTTYTTRLAYIGSSLEPETVAKKLDLYA